MNSSDIFHQDERFHYIRVRQIKNISPKLSKSGEESGLLKSLFKKKYVLRFSLATRVSETTFEALEGGLSREELEKLGKEAHMFSFEADEMMIISLYEEGNERVWGYANLAMAPFIEMPHTCHSVTIHLMERLDSQELRNEQMACISINLLFLLNFKAELKISPIEAQILHNTSTFSQMRPFVRMTINGQKKKSLVADGGGIHPNWEKYARKVRESAIQVFHYEGSEVVSKPTEQADEAHENQFTFNLSSAGHQIKIEIISMPLIGQDASLVGSTIVRTKCNGFFNEPFKLDNSTETKKIDLFWTNPLNGEKQKAAVLKFQTCFYFDSAELKKGVIDSDSEDEFLE